MRPLLVVLLLACGGASPTELKDADRTHGCYRPLTLPDATVIRVWYPVCPDTLKIPPLPVVP